MSLCHPYTCSNLFSFVEDVDGKSKGLKTAIKKGGVGLGGRRALNDITNKASLHHEASSRKKDVPKEELNVAEEMFLHDHKKCIEAQKSAMDTFYLDTVLPGHGNYTCFLFQCYMVTF
jgi:hypothetical protein